MTGQLENRWSGQGHRAGLNRQQLGREDPWESIDARYGEERRLYLQERGDDFNNYAASKPRGRVKDRFGDDVLGGNAATPRSFNDSRHHDRGRAAPPPRAAAHARAPSPRSFGTVRFAPGGRRFEQNASGSQPIINPGLQAAAALRAATANVNPAPRSTLSMPTGLEPGTSGQAVAPRAVNNPGLQTVAALRASAMNGTPTEQHRIVSDRGAQATAALRTSAANSATAQKPMPNSSSSPAQTTTTAHATPAGPTIAVHDPRLAEMYRNLALWHAANPGEDCDNYHEKYPDRLQYLGPARDKLIKEAIGLAKRGDEYEIAEEVKHHPERSWMVDAAKKAKSQVEQDSDEQIKEYCATHPRQMPFVRAATAVFTRHSGRQMRQIQLSPLCTISAKTTSDATTDSSSRSSDTDDTAETAASSPHRSGLGSLVAVFFDVAGRFLGNHCVRVNGPVQATINVTSRAQRFDPRDLIGAIESLAQSMVDRTQGLEDVRLAEDGLWVDKD